MWRRLKVPMFSSIFISNSREMTDLLSSGNVKHIHCSPLFMALHNLPYVVIPSICVELGSKEVWS